MGKFVLQTKKPIAFDSPDHIMPYGTKQDNSKNFLFNKKLYLLFNKKPLSILDIGCAGGGFVRSCIEDGHIAIGIEGSDYSKKIKRAEWGHIPNNLFTCDATTDFFIKAIDLISNKERDMKFNVVTAWEFIEHIRTDDLPKVCDNIIRHLAKDGLLIMSISPNEEVINGVKLHQTVQDQNWWLDFFQSYGFTNHSHLISYFGNDWIRGPLQGAPGSFHLALTYGNGNPPELPPKFTIMKLNSISTVINAYRHFSNPKMWTRWLLSYIPR